MRLKRPNFGRDSKRLQRSVHLAMQLPQSRRIFSAGPEHARRTGVREEPQTGEWDVENRLGRRQSDFADVVNELVEPVDLPLAKRSFRIESYPWGNE